MLHLDRPEELADFPHRTPVFAEEQIAGQLLGHGAVAPAGRTSEHVPEHVAIDRRLRELRQHVGDPDGECGFAEVAVFADDDRVDEMRRDVLQAGVQAVVETVAHQLERHAGLCRCVRRHRALGDVDVRRACDEPGLVGIGQIRPHHRQRRRTQGRQPQRRSPSALSFPRHVQGRAASGTRAGAVSRGAGAPERRVRTWGVVFMTARMRCIPAMRRLWQSCRSGQESGATFFFLRGARH